jgi:hypothetical protein
MTRIFRTIIFLSLLSFMDRNISSVEQDLTVSYSIGVMSKSGNAGIGETYNGGVETVFAGSRQARLRLVSLMRTQSVFVSTGSDRLEKVTILKESGRNKYSTKLTPEEWTKYNKKYEGLTCAITEDTVRILNYQCRKAIISLKDGRKMTAWFTPTVHKPICSFLEPAFSRLPGLVLKYEYTYRRKTITYTATSISHDPINADVFTIPR